MFFSGLDALCTAVSIGTVDKENIPPNPRLTSATSRAKPARSRSKTFAQDSKYHTHVNNGHAQRQGHTQAHGVRSSRSTCRITEYCFFNAFASSLFLNIELHVNELKDKLRAGRLAVSGKKADLVERLMNPPASRPSRKARKSSTQVTLSFARSFMLLS